jgi:hypothetical protein
MTGTQLNRAIGAVFIVLPALVVVAVILLLITVGAGVDPARGRIAESLQDINDNELAYLLSLALDTASNVVGVATAAAAYILFRERDRALALVAFAGLLAASATFMIVDIGGFTLHRLAEDLAEGGAGGVGDAEILELARTVAWMVGYSQLVSLSFLGAGMIGLGAVIAWAPQSGGATQAASTVPRWVGWLAVASGVLVLLAWLSTIDEALWVVAGIGVLGRLLTLLALAWWFLSAAEEPVAVT